MNKTTTAPNRVKNTTLNDTPKIVSTILPAIPTLQAVKIVDVSSLTKATEYLSKANKFLDALTKDKEAITKPLNESLKAVRAKYKPTEETLTNIIANIRKQMQAYQTEQVRLQQVEEQKIANRVEKGTLTLPTAIKKLEAMPELTNKTTTDDGSVSFRATPTLKITDPLAIPRDYLTINEFLILSELKKGTIIPGATIEIIQVPYNKR